MRLAKRDVSMKQPARMIMQTQRIAEIVKKAMKGCAVKRSVFPNIREISMPRNGEFVLLVKSTIREVSVANSVLITSIFPIGTTWERFWIDVTGCQM